MLAPLKRLKVGVSYNEPLLAHGIVAILAREPDLEVDFDDGDPQDQQADVLIADYKRALELMQQAQRRRGSPPPRVVLLSTGQREQDVRRAIEIGVPGFLALGAAAQDLALAVRAVGSGARFYDSSVAERMAESLSREPLTGREAEVLHLLARGMCNKSIARDLSIATGTVKAHVKAILAKLDATSRTHAATLALQRGLVDVPELQG
ncbi:MAG: response regulator transcription factor [Roseateles sp.]|nr:MAG: response regulator transcription factor [Roseateles sp.]